MMKPFFPSVCFIHTMQSLFSKVDSNCPILLSHFILGTVDVFTFNFSIGALEKYRNFQSFSEIFFEESLKKRLCRKLVSLVNIIVQRPILRVSQLVDKITNMSKFGLNRSSGSGENNGENRMFRRVVTCV